MSYRNGLTTEIETITPTMAERYLEANVNNRKLSQRHVNAYAEDMRQSRWDLNGETIKFAEDGTLLDGQTRLWACIEAGTPFRAVVVRGLPREVQVTMDNGRSRQFNDHLQIKGLPNTHRLQGALNCLLHIKHGARHNTVTNARLEELLNKHPGIIDALDATNGVKGGFFNWSIAAAWFYLAYYVVGERRLAVQAINAMATGIPNYDGDPMHALRERWIREHLRNRGGVTSATHRMGWVWATMAAWNAFREGDQVLQVKLRSREVRMAGLDYDRI